MVLAHKRRAWLDNVVLKHQSSALVPIFDPRPGKAIIPTLVDMPIPSPGMCVYIQYISNVCVLQENIKIHKLCAVWYYMSGLQ